MKRIQSWSVACGLGISLGFLMLVTASSVPAQGTYTRPMTSPNGAPAVSPYLNLVRGGNPAVNYYGLVRPQMDAQHALQQLQSGVAAPASSLPMDATPNSGHPVQFMNFSHYFNNNVGGGLSGRGAGGQAGGPATLRR